VHRLVELLKLERDRPPEFQDGGAAVRAWARRVRELEGLLRRDAPEVWRRLVGGDQVDGG